VRPVGGEIGITFADRLGSGHHPSQTDQREAHHGDFGRDQRHFSVSRRTNCERQRIINDLTRSVRILTADIEHQEALTGVRDLKNPRILHGGATPAGVGETLPCGNGRIAYDSRRHGLIG